MKFKEQIVEKEFFDDVKRMDIDGVKDCIQRGVNINCCNQDGDTALTMVARKDIQGLFPRTNKLAEKCGFGKNCGSLDDAYALVKISYTPQNPGQFIYLDHYMNGLSFDPYEEISVENKGPMKKSSLDKEPIIKLLLQNGADVNAKGDCKVTPLHWAAYENNEAVAKILLLYGAETSIDSPYGDALKVAEKRAGKFGKFPPYKFYDKVHEIKRDFGTSIKLKTEYNEQKKSLYKVADLIKSQRELEKESLDNIKFLKYFDLACNPENTSLLINNPYFSIKVFEMAKENDKMVNFLTKIGFSINILDQKGDNIIHRRIKDMATAKELKTLIESGANINQANNTGESPLSSAIKMNRIEIVELLLKNGSSIEQRFANGDTLLHNAARTGNLEICELLIKRSVPINERNLDDVTALDVSVQQYNCKTNIVKKLIWSGADLNNISNKGMSPLSTTIEDGKISMARLLVESGADIEKKICARNTITPITPLMLALEKHQEEIAFILLEKGADVNAKNQIGDTPLHIAAKHFEFQAVDERIRCLVQKGADVIALNNNGDSVYSLVSDKIKKYFRELNIDQETPYNTFDREPIGASLSTQKYLRDIMKNEIFKEISNQDLQRTKQCIEAGNSINDIVLSGQTPLHKAVETKNLDLIRLLLENKADIHMADNLGLTPIAQSKKIAKETGNRQILKLLRSYDKERFGCIGRICSFNLGINRIYVKEKA